MENLKELLDFNEEFIRETLKNQNELIPQIVFCKNKKISVFLADSRDAVKQILLIAEKIKPDWLVSIAEGYMEEIEKDSKEDYEKEYEYGSLGERFRVGDKKIKEAIFIQAYSKEGKLMRIIKKDTLSKFGEDVENFIGYLTVSDVERVFW